MKTKADKDGEYQCTSMCTNEIQDNHKNLNDMIIK